MSNPAKMIEARGREACLSPVVYGRDASVRLVRDGSCAPEGIDQDIGKSKHAASYAETAYEAQSKFCRNGICHIGTHAVHVPNMEIDEIRARMADKGYGQADLANLLGIDPSAVSKRLTGKRPFKHHEMLKTEAWLAGEAREVIVQGEGVRMVPVVGIVAAGNFREAIQHPSGHLPFAASDTPRNAIALRVSGDSMDLEIQDEGTVMVDLDDKALFPGHLYVVLNEEGEATFKQFENDPARLVPRSTNPAHSIIQIGDGQQFTVVGRVTALYRRR